MGIATSALLKTVGDNLGDVFDGIVGNQGTEQAAKDAFGTFDHELLSNLASAGAGAVSSFLTPQFSGGEKTANG